MVKQWRVFIDKAHLLLSIKEMEFVLSTYSSSINWITTSLSAWKAISVNSGKTWRKFQSWRSWFFLAQSTWSYNHCTLQKPDSFHRIGEQTLVRTALSQTFSEQHHCGIWSGAVYCIYQGTSWWHYRECKWLTKSRCITTTLRLFCHRQLHTHFWPYRELRRTWRLALGWEEVVSQESKNTQQVCMESHSAL